MNSFGTKFRFTSFGESHGAALGAVIDGVPAGLAIDEAFIQSELDRRKPGQNKYTSPRKEADQMQILSGVFEGMSTGMPLAIVVFNKNQRSKDYDNIKHLFRPGHADFSWFHKYGIRDYRGGGRSSARENIARVAAGAVAKLILKTLNVNIQAGIYSIGDLAASEFDFDHAKTSEICSLDKNIENQQKQLIEKLKKEQDSVGASALLRVQHSPKNLGEPIYHKLDAKLAEAMMGINAVKAVEIGSGVHCSSMQGSLHNDEMNENGFMSNHAGGILGGISNGNDILMKVHFKPTASIFQEQNTQNIAGEAVAFSLKGRHDPCVGIRGTVVVEAMAAAVLTDMLLLNMTAKMDYLQKVYTKV